MKKKGSMSVLLHIVAMIVTGIIGIFEIGPETIQIVCLFAYIFLFFAGVIRFALSIKKENKKERDNAELRKDYIYVSKSNSQGVVLHLSKRNPIVRTGFHINKSTDDKITKVPEQIHFGAVTVGGVTTGGTYKTGGYNEVRSKFNGLYELQYEGRNVSRIELSYSLLEEAKKSKISQYLCDVEAILGEENRMNRQSKMILDDLDECYIMVVDYVPTTMNQYYELKSGLNRKYGYPTYEKCLEILDWIGGKD